MNTFGAPLGLRRRFLIGFSFTCVKETNGSRRDARILPALQLALRIPLSGENVRFEFVQTQWCSSLISRLLRVVNVVVKMYVITNIIVLIVCRARG